MKLTDAVLIEALNRGTDALADGRPTSRERRYADAADAMREVIIAAQPDAPAPTCATCQQFRGDKATGRRHDGGWCAFGVQRPDASLLMFPAHEHFGCMLHTPRTTQ